MTLTDDFSPLLPNPASGYDAGTPDFDINVTVVESVLKRTPIIGVGEYRCPVEHPQFSGGGPQKCNFIVFPRSSVRIGALDARPDVCTPNTVNLYNVGDTYVRKPISREGALCDWIAVAPTLLREIGSRYDPRLIDEPRQLFDRSLAPLKPTTYIAQRALFKALHADPFVSALGVEECVIRIIEAVFEQTTASREKVYGMHHGRRVHTAGKGRHTAIVHETTAILARDFGSALSVSDLASRVHCSTGYLSRMFRRITGSTLHDYQQQLRLRNALQLLEESWFDFAAVAVHLGFANHSHFTNVFRRQFGITPTAFVRQASANLLADMHAILDKREAALRVACKQYATPA